MSYQSDQTFYILGNNDDHLDHEALFYQLDKLGYPGKTIHPYSVTTQFTSEGARYYSDGEEIRPALVLGWVYEDILIKGMYLLTAMERSGIPVVNTAQTLFCGQNKYLNSEGLQRNHIPHFPMLCGYSEKDLEVWIDQLTFPLVLKPIVGVGGQSVVKVESPESLRSLARTLSGFQEYYYVQPYLEKPNRDIRVICVNYKAVSSFYKYSPEGKWITNVASGGTAVWKEEIEPELARIAEEACQSMNALIGGVDLVEDHDSGTYRVFEVNTCPNFYLKQFMADAPEITEEEIAKFLVNMAKEYGTI